MGESMDAVGLDLARMSQQNFFRFLQWLSPDLDEGAGRPHPRS
jgi:hypothetical protein